jgi:hypothetical protein
LALIQGKESTGANSIAVFNGRDIVIVGGDFANDKDTTQNCVLVRMEVPSFSGQLPHPTDTELCGIYF